MTTATPVPDPRLGNPDWIDNWTLGPGLRFEMLEGISQRFFLCQTEVSSDEIAAFEAPAGFRLGLAGSAAADVAFFSRSPDADVNGPLEIVEMGGRRFGYVARAAGASTMDGGALDLTIDKHHTVLFLAGRTISVLEFGDGTTALPAWGSRDPAAELTDSMLEPDWTLRKVQLARDLIAEIPNPSRVVVLDQAFGFHGPVPSSLIKAAAI